MSELDFTHCVERVGFYYGMHGGKNVGWMWVGFYLCPFLELICKKLFGWIEQGLDFTRVPDLIA